jgi:hypothetical protein
MPTLIFWILFAIALLSSIGMQWSEKLISVSKEEYKKNFLLKLQFAKSRKILIDMINSVTGRGRGALGFNLGIDYAFMIGLYGFLSLFSYRLTANHPADILNKTGFVLSWLMILPLLADIFENYCLARWSFDEKWNGPFSLYYVAVRIKWIIAIFVAAFCVTVFVINLAGFQRIFFA